MKQSILFRTTAACAEKASADSLREPFLPHQTARETQVPLSSMPPALRCLQWEAWEETATDSEEVTKTALADSPRAKVPGAASEEVRVADSAQAASAVASVEEIDLPGLVPKGHFHKGRRKRPGKERCLHLRTSAVFQCRRGSGAVLRTEAPGFRWDSASWF